MELLDAVSNVGFPIALAIYLLVNERKDKERTLNALEASVKVIERSNKLEERILGALRNGK